MERRKNVTDLLNCCGTFVCHKERHHLVTVAAGKELKNVQEEIQNIEVTGFGTDEKLLHVQRSHDVLVHSIFMTELSVLRSDTALNVVHKVE